MSIPEVLTGALGLDTATAQTQTAMNRVAAILDYLNYVQYRPRKSGTRSRRYQLKEGM